MSIAYQTRITMAISDNASKRAVFIPGHKETNEHLSIKRALLKNVPHHYYAQDNKVMIFSI